jgi:nucleotide-binding universal stress UspA family protein
MTRSILVATDGFPGAMGALRVARRLAERDGARVEVIAVYEPITLYGTDPLAPASGVPPQFAIASMEALRDRVKAQLAEVGGPAIDWQVIGSAGPVSQAIARAAVRREADLILLGLRHPSTVERWIGRETLLRLAHLAHVPILAVAADATDLPARVLVATDFSDFSARVARAAAQWLAPGGRIDLAHVTWSPSPGDRWDGITEWQKTYRIGVQRRLDEVAESVKASGVGEVHTHILSGDPSTAILQLAEELNAHLIAAGSHGVGFLGRVVMGSVSSKLVHGASCSLLIAPPEDVSPELRVEMTEPEVLAELGLAAELALAGRTNEGGGLVVEPVPDPGLPGGGAGRRDEVGGSGVYPASLGHAPEDAVVRGQAEWGQGDLGARGYDEAGSSELFFYDAELRAAGVEPKRPGTPEEPEKPS